MSTTPHFARIVASCALVTVIACGNKGGVEGVDTSGAQSSKGTGGAPNANNGGANTNSTPGFIPSNTGGASSDPGSTGGAPQITPWPPSPDYTNVTDVTFGAYALGPDISNGNVPTNAATTCEGLLYGVARDFKMGTQSDGHPDFETAPDSTRQSGVKGIVEQTLGGDGKPWRIGTELYGDRDLLSRDVTSLKLSVANAVRTEPFPLVAPSPALRPDSVARFDSVLSSHSVSRCPESG